MSSVRQVSAYRIPKIGFPDILEHFSKITPGNRICDGFIWVLKGIQPKDSRSVRRHCVNLTVNQVRELSGELDACADGVADRDRSVGNVVNFFVDKDNVLQVTIKR